MLGIPTARAMNGFGRSFNKRKVIVHKDATNTTNRVTEIDDDVLREEEVYVHI